MILDATNRSIEIKLGGTVTTNQLPVVSSYADHDAVAKTYVPGAQTAVTNNTTAVTIVSAPASGKQRQIKSINIQNKDTAAIKVTVQYNDNTTIRELVTFTLQADDTLQYDYEEGWRALDSVGKLKVQVGSGGGGGLADADYGDITVSGGATVMTIDPDVVTFAKMQNINTDKLLGRDTAAAGDVEELAVSGGIEFTGAGGIQTSAFTGDVTKAAGGTAQTIANDAVSLAKMANMNTDKLLGRDTAGVGDPEELSVSGGLEFTGAGGIQRSALTGDVTAAAGSNSVVVDKASEDFALTGDISPTTIAGIVNDYAPTGLATASVIRQDLSASAQLTGLTGGSDGRLIILHNISSSYSLVISHNDAGSAAANRFYVPGVVGGSDNPAIIVMPRGMVILRYDSVVSLWVVQAGINLRDQQTLMLRPRATPAQITADQNNYNPTGQPEASYIELTSDASRNITGMALNTGKFLILHNGGANNIVLKHEDAGSSTFNRFSLPNGQDYTIKPDEVVVIFGTTNTLSGASRWRMFGVQLRAGEVLYSNIQNVTTDRLLGRDTAGSGVVEELTVGGNLEFTGAGGIQRGALSGDVTSAAGSGSVVVDKASEDFALTGDISPAAFTGVSVNDYNPTGFSAASIIYQDATADTGLTGFAGGADGRILILKNISTTNNLIDILDEGVGSSAANRIKIPGGTTNREILLAPNNYVIFIYNSNISRWQVVFQSNGGEVSGPLMLRSVLTPPQITANQNDYLPTNAYNTSWWQLSTDASRDITGISIAIVGRILVIQNVGSFNIVLKHENASSVATNRFNFIDGLDYTVEPGEVVILLASYTGIAQRWRLASTVIKNNSVTLAKIQDIATARFLGRTTAGTGDPEQLTGTQATAMLDNMVGDTGTGGTKGLAPAPAAGDAAAGKFLKADGTWATTPGGGGGDSITVNGVAVVDADFDDATPAAVGTGKNVKWQKDASSPANVSAYVEAAGSAVAGIITTGAQNIGGEKTFDADVNFAMEVAMSGVATASPSANQNDYSPTGIADASILRLTPTASIIITGIGTTKNGKRLLVVNASTDYLILLIPESAASTAANRFAFSGGFPFFAMMPGDSLELWYDNTSSRWRPLHSNHILPKSQFDEWTDWPSPPNNAMVGVNSGTGAAVRGSTAGAGATEKIIGAVELATGTTATGRAALNSNGLNTGNGFAPAQGAWLGAWRGKVATLSDGTNRYQVRVGNHDGAQGTDVTDGVYFEYDDATSTDWRTAVAAASARTKATITGFTVSASVYHIMGIFINPGWTRADYFYSTDGLTFQFATSVSSGLPSSTQLTDGLELNINKTLGTSDRTYSIDWCGFRNQVNRG